MSKAANGAGSITHRVQQQKGHSYDRWIVRFTVGRDPGTGKQIQKTRSFKTQKEASQYLREVTTQIDHGDYQEPSGLTVADWLTIWQEEYLGNVKPLTVSAYRGQIKNHIAPALGATKLEALNTHSIQRFYNDLTRKKHLSPKTVKNVHGILHEALHQAVAIGYLRSNPAEYCVLPRQERAEIKPLDQVQSRQFIEAAQDDPFADLFTFTLFTGLREGEVLGLRWSRVDFKKGRILIDQQLQKGKEKGSAYYYAPLKNDKSRTIAPAPSIMRLLEDHRKKQLEQRLKAGPAWNNPDDLVFTNETGGHLVAWTVLRHFKKIAKSIGLPEARFHDLRHSFAVASLASGDDVKTVQSNLGHATAAFTLDVYGHCTDQMREASAARMEGYLHSVMGQ